MIFLLEYSNNMQRQTLHKHNIYTKYLLFSKYGIYFLIWNVGKAKFLAAILYANALILQREQAQRL